MELVKLLEQMREVILCAVCDTMETVRILFLCMHSGFVPTDQCPFFRKDKEKSEGKNGT